MRHSASPHAEPPANGVPEATSAEALGRYIPGRLLKESTGPAWRHLRARLLEQPCDVARFSVPAVAEPFLVRVCSGTAVIEERIPGGKWIKTQARPGDLFLTSPGTGYEMRVRLAGPAPFLTLQVLMGLPLIARASEDVFGHATVAQLRDISVFNDEFVSALMSQLDRELRSSHPSSALLVQSIGQSLAVHLVRHYTADTSVPRSAGGLPGHLLRKITDCMAGELHNEFSLARYAALAGISACHFSRAFKHSTGLSPSRYFLNLRIEAARCLLRETRQSVIQIALAVGYTSPSHFSQVFRRETGAAPGDYRRQS